MIVLWLCFFAANFQIFAFAFSGRIHAYNTRSSIVRTRTRFGKRVTVDVRSTRIDEIEGLEPPVTLVEESEKKVTSVSESGEFDYVVIGSGIGGLSCAALLRW